MPSIAGENIACGDPSELKSFFAKLTKKELSDVWSSWNIQTVEENIPKKKMIQRVVSSSFEQGITYNQVAEIELAYYRAQPTVRKWKVWQIINRKQEYRNAMLDSLRVPSVLQSKLEIEFGRYFTSHTCVRQIDGQLWIRLGIYDDIQRGSLPTSPKYSTYIVYYPHSTYVFISSLKKEYKEFILKGLAAGLEVEDVVDPGQELHSNDVKSLADLVLYPTSQGPYRSARLDAPSDNPLELLSSKKRKQTEKDEREKQRLKNMPIREDNEIYESRDKRVKNIFGDHDRPQPALNNFTINFNTRVRASTNSNSNSNSTTEVEPGPKIEMSVVLSGANVLEGLKLLTKSGTASDLHEKILQNMFLTNKITIE